VSQKHALCVVLLLISALACSGGNSTTTSPSPTPTAIPTAPTSSAAPAPVPAQIPGERWNLTVVFRSVSGSPAACVSRYSEYLGLSYDWLMAIQRSGESMVLIYDVGNVGEGLTQYAGTAVGKEFTAARATGNGNGRIFCSGGQTFDARSDSSQVSGRFSDDGRTLTTTEVGSYRLTSGETLTFQSEWTASRQ
jgi:hypothetical protein